MRDHSEFCEMDGRCPTLNIEACGKIVVWHPVPNQFTVYCFACKKTHTVKT